MKQTKLRWQKQKKEKKEIFFQKTNSKERNRDSKNGKRRGRKERRFDKD